MITHYDLFAGIGGFSLALKEVFNDQEIETIFCEWDNFCTVVLKQHWPEAVYYGDIKDLVADTSEQGRARSGGEGEDKEQGLSILTGGFPCQPFSHAGRRKGTADDRYQWPNMFAVIRNVRPDWVIAENVRGLVTWNDGLVLEQVCADLESEGYEVQPIIIPAVAVNAPHRRDRVWIIANRGSKEPRRIPGGTRQEVSKTRGASPNPRPQRRQARSDKSLRPESQESERTDGQRFSWDSDWREVALATCIHGMDDGLSQKLDGATYRGKRTDTITYAQWRKESLKAYGNAIVPQVAMEIFKAIKETEERGLNNE